MNTHEINSLKQLAAAHLDWDALWVRSELAFPSTQAQQLAEWMRHFAPEQQFHAIAVETDGRWQAALPLVERRLLRVLRTLSLPGNEWSPVGNLLLDSAADMESTGSALLAALDQLTWILLRLEPIRLDAPQWQMLIEALARHGYPHTVEPLFDVGQVTTLGDWDAYFASRSRNLRRDLGKSWRRLEKEGPLATKIYLNPDDEQIHELLARGFTVEDRSWKGRGGTSVLKTPGLLNYYQSQAASFRDREQLQISMLELDGRAIAFEYGWRSHATYYSFKVGYDETFQRYSPGQLLRMKLLEQAFGDDAINTFDFFGPLNSALAAWATESFAVGRIVAARPTRCGRGMIAAYARLRRLERRLSGRDPATQYTLRTHETVSERKLVEMV